MNFFGKFNRYKTLQGENDKADGSSILINQQKKSFEVIQKDGGSIFGMMNDAQFYIQTWEEVKQKFEQRNNQNQQFQEIENKIYQDTKEIKEIEYSINEDNQVHV